MEIEDLKKQKCILFECISGSRSQGLATPESDTDIKGVFVLPKNKFYGLDYIPQVSNATNDVVYYELKRFFELLAKNNPNILEMLGVDDAYVLTRHPLFSAIKPELFLSKLCKETFANYAMAQIKKAKGLNKKIMNPLSKEKKSIVDFCYIIDGQNSVSVAKWLTEHNYKQEHCGLVDMQHMRDVYSLFYTEDNRYNYNGIVKKESSEMISVSSIPKGEKPAAVFYCNKDGFSAYCKDYQEYWEWVDKRNQARYESTIGHGKNYDAKNIMHTFRLLTMAEEILRDGKIIVKRPDRDELLKIKNGEYDYDVLMRIAEEKILRIEELYSISPLPEHPDIKRIENVLVNIREQFYG